MTFLRRFRNVREYQYVLTRDLHDWMAEAYPLMPIEIAESFHEPKFGSQSSPFSPLKGQTAP